MIDVQIKAMKSLINRKMFLGGSQSVSKLTTWIMDEFDWYLSDRSYEYLVGDCQGADTLFQQVLFDNKIERVTVYTSEDEPRVNIGGWPVVRVDAPKKGRYPYLHHAAKDKKMAEDAGSAFMLWDGRSRGTAANIAGTIRANKPCHVLKSETMELFETETYKDPASIDKLRAMLPEPKADRIGCFEAMPRELLERFIPQLVPSKAVSDHLIESGIKPRRMIEIILNAPVSLEKKAAILEELAERENFLHDYCDNLETHKGIFSPWEIIDAMERDHSFGYCLREIKKALAALDCSGGGILLLGNARFDDEANEALVGGGIAYYSSLASPCTSMDAVFASIRDTNEMYALNGVETEPDEDDLEWYEIEKCEPMKNGRMKKTYRYYMIGDELMYFDKNRFDGDEMLPHSDRRFSSGMTDPDFPIPFETGDIVTLDCRPFAPVMHALLLAVDNADCCGVRMLHRDKNGLWHNSALKHKHGWGRYTPLLSPLYRLEKYEGELPEDHKIFLEVQNFIRDNKLKASWMEDQIMRKDGTTAEELIDIMNKR